jgi:hypothetical protein
MRRRRLVGALVLFALLAAGVFALWPSPDPPSPITFANWFRIGEGLAPSDVEAILGPAETVLTPLEVNQKGIPGYSEAGAGYWFRPENSPVERYLWRGKKGAITVDFDASGQAMGKEWHKPKPLMELLRRFWNWDFKTHFNDFVDLVRDGPIEVLRGRKSLGVILALSFNLARSLHLLEVSRLPTPVDGSFSRAV